MINASSSTCSRNPSGSATILRYPSVALGLNPKMHDLARYYVANALGDNRAMAILWISFEAHKCDRLTLSIDSGVADGGPCCVQFQVRTEDHAKCVHVSAPSSLSARLGITELLHMTVADAYCGKRFRKDAFGEASSPRLRKLANVNKKRHANLL
jgi:hypothetical protein